MTALVATDVAVTQLDIGRKSIFSKRKFYRVKLVFGDGSLTYPAGGVPMPAFGTLGFVRFLDGLLEMETPPDDTNIYKYDQPNNKVRIWVSSTGAEFSGAPAASRTIIATAIGW